MRPKHNIGHYVIRQMTWITLGIFTLLSSHTGAQTKTLLGSGQPWHTANSWNPTGVPSNNDSVVINGYVNIEAGMDAVAKHVHIGVLGYLDVERNNVAGTIGRLFIANAPGNGFVNYGHIENNGRIRIRTSQDTALINYGEIYVLVTARLEIDSTVDGPGLIHGNVLASSTTQTLSNAGTIDIRSTNGHGIICRDTISNLSTGYITINQINGIGLDIVDTSDALINENLFEIIDCSLTGIDNNGILMNYDSLIVDGSKPDGIINRYECQNFVNASIYISAIGNGVSLRNTGNLSFLNNEGSITLKSGLQGFSNFGRFQNSGVVDISDMQSTQVDNYGFFHNEEGALIKLRNQSLFSAVAFWNHSSADSTLNEGFISFSSIDLALFNEGHFSNMDTITFRGYNIAALTNESYFINGPLAYIKASGTNSPGIHNVELTDTIVNEGKIQLLDIGPEGVINKGVFINRDSLLIEEVQVGICNGSETVTAASFINEGFIDLFNTLTIGMTNYAEFKVPSSGKLLVRSTHGDYLETMQLGLLECSGILDLQ